MIWVAPCGCRFEFGPVNGEVRNAQANLKRVLSKCADHAPIPDAIIVDMCVRENQTVQQTLEVLLLANPQLQDRDEFGQIIWKHGERPIWSFDAQRRLNIVMRTPANAATKVRFATDVSARRLMLPFQINDVDVT